MIEARLDVALRESRRWIHRRCGGRQAARCCRDRRVVQHAHRDAIAEQPTRGVKDELLAALGPLTALELYGDLLTREGCEQIGRFDHLVHGGDSSLWTCRDVGRRR